MKVRAVLFLLAAISLIQIAALAQDTSVFVEDAGNKYWIHPDIAYSVENGHKNKLDVIYPHNATAPVPAVIYIHGGGWFWGDKARPQKERHATRILLAARRFRSPHG